MIYVNNNHINLLTRNVPGPERLNIELTTSCNLKCIMCRGAHNYTRKDRNGKHLTIETFISILNGTDLNRLRILNFAGTTEPLLNPDIIPILTICRENNLLVEFITNGMLLTPQISKQILGCSSEIHISFAGSNKESFESIRKGADFELVCENIRTLSELKRSNNKQYPHIWLNPILMKKNINELPEIIELARELGCQGVACSHLIVNSPELIEESLFFHKEECNTILQKAEILANGHHISLIIPEYFSSESNCKEENNENIEPWKKCRFLWNYAILGIDGILPCCTIDKTNFDSNVVKNKFMDIWNNDWYANMRYRLLTGNPPQCCIDCRDSSGKDVNNMAAHFKEDLLPEAISYAQTLPGTPLPEVPMQAC